MRLSPRSIPGPLSVQNTGSLDWGPQGLIAYGSHNSVAVIHVDSLHLLQVLAAHNFSVTNVSVTDFGDRYFLSKRYDFDPQDSMIAHVTAT